LGLGLLDFDYLEGTVADARISEIEGTNADENEDEKDERYAINFFKDDGKGGSKRVVSYGGGERCLERAPAESLAVAQPSDNDVARWSTSLDDLLDGLLEEQYRGQVSYLNVPPPSAT
jgi:hypothetical protein